MAAAVAAAVVAKHHVMGHMENIAETTIKMPPECECLMSGTLSRQVIG